MVETVIKAAMVISGILGVWLLVQAAWLTAAFAGAAAVFRAGERRMIRVGA